MFITNSGDHKELEVKLPLILSGSKRKVGRKNDIFSYIKLTLTSILVFKAPGALLAIWIDVYSGDGGFFGGDVAGNAWWSREAGEECAHSKPKPESCNTGGPKNHSSCKRALRVPC
jgi:hypothetical protein